MLFAVSYCYGSNCDNDYSEMLFATQLMGAVASEAPGLATFMNTMNGILGRALGDDGSCLLKEVDYRIDEKIAKDRAKDAILFLRSIMQSIRDSTGCSDSHTPERCIESMKNTYTTWERLRNDMKLNHYLHFDTAFKDDGFDDPALYEPFVLYGQLELMLHSILYDLCGRDRASSVPHCNRDKMRENKNSFKRYGYVIL